MEHIAQVLERRTSADVVFDKLYEEIVSVRLLPGTKMSEAEIAAQFGISRQPVRDAFSRLGNLGFLLIRPQKATEVQKFSAAAITSARFIRAAIEVEVVRRAATMWTNNHTAPFENNLAAQEKAMRDNDVDAFHKLDYEFHRQLCETAGVAFAFESIMENKAQIDRLCVLSMMDKDAMTPLVADHKEIFDCLLAQDPARAETAMRQHLNRLDSTIEDVRKSHPEYFL